MSPTNKNGVHVNGKGETCIVATKLPAGVILQLSRKFEAQEPILGGGYRTYDVWRKDGPRYPVKGTAHPHGTVPRFQMAGEACGRPYALTSEIPRDFFEAWLEQNKDADIVQRGLIFMMPTVADAESKAKENAALFSGLEPIDTEKLPKGVTTADRK